MKCPILMVWLACTVYSLPSQAADSRVDYPQVAPDVGFAEVAALPWRPADQRLAYGEADLQFGLLWMPAEEHNRAVTVVLIHGGCWLNEFTIDHTFATATALADAGYGVWSLEYRRTGDAGGAWPGTYRDIVQGINHVANLPQSLADNPMVLIGHSAGGHLAVLAGSQDEQLQKSPDLVVGLAAITDVTRYALGSNSCETATQSFMSGTPEEKPQAYALANPATHGVHPETVLLYGDKDAIVAEDQASLLNAESILSPGAGHFDWVYPGTPAFNALLQLLRDTF